MSERREPLPPANDELVSLIEAIVTGTATPAERDRLEAHLRADSQARLFYVSYLYVHAHLQWMTRGDSFPLAESHSPRTSRTRQRGRPFHERLRWVVAASLLLAVGLLTAVLIARHGSEEGEVPDLPGAPAGSVAVLIGNHNTVWEADMALPTGTGSALPPGRLKLRAGIVEVAFHGGGEVLL